MLKCRLAPILNCLPKFYGAPADGLNFLDPRKVSTPFLLEKLIIIVGSSGLEPLPKGPDLQSGCRIRTTFATQLIFKLLKFKTFYCSNFRFLYLERESNPRPFRVKEIRSRYAIEAKCMFLNFLLINIQTKYILYPRQELNLTPLVKSQLPTPVCYEGECGGHRFIIYSWVSTEPVVGYARFELAVSYVQGRRGLRAPLIPVC